MAAVALVAEFRLHDRVRLTVGGGGRGGIALGSPGACAGPLICRGGGLLQLRLPRRLARRLLRLCEWAVVTQFHALRVGSEEARAVRIGPQRQIVARAQVCGGEETIAAFLRAHVARVFKVACGPRSLERARARGGREVARRSRGGDAGRGPCGGRGALVRALGPERLDVCEVGTALLEHEGVALEAFLRHVQGRDARRVTEPALVMSLALRPEVRHGGLARGRLRRAAPAAARGAEEGQDHCRDGAVARPSGSGEPAARHRRIKAQ
mmetsp:Transcript_7227/g.21038  ORF Transcript_7227/g.21038 Transcript_7227/m.21038 type:complete len:267 (-) Transcript_7227:8-808(-)